MSHQFDATLKEIVGQEPADFREVFRLPAIAPAQALNIDLSTLSAATDVALGFGDPLSEVVDVNFQSGPDPHVASRLLLYNTALHLKFQVPVRSLLILLRPKAETPDLTGNLSYDSGGKRVIFEYDVMRLWSEPVEPFLTGGVGILPLAPLCQMPKGKRLKAAIRDVVHEIDRRLALLPDHAQAVRLMTAAFILTGLRIDKGILADIYQGVTVMHNTSAYDQILEEGILTGEIRTSHEVLLKLGRVHWGDPDPKIEASLTAIQDLKRLKRMLDRLIDVKTPLKSWKALLAIK
jgi:hypothetical protein